MSIYDDMILGEIFCMVNAPRSESTDWEEMLPALIDTLQVLAVALGDEGLLRTWRVHANLAMSERWLSFDENAVAVWRLLCKFEPKGYWWGQCPDAGGLYGFWPNDYKAIHNYNWSEE